MGVHQGFVQAAPLWLLLQETAAPSSSSRLMALFSASFLLGDSSSWSRSSNPNDVGVSSKSWGRSTAIDPATVCVLLVLGVGSPSHGAVVSIYSCTCVVARRSVPSTALVLAWCATETGLVSFVWCFMCTWRFSIRL